MAPPIVQHLPRAWSDRLFEATLTGHTEALWLATASILLDALPGDRLVVWETFHSTLYRKGADGALVIDRSGEQAQTLRGPQLYTLLNTGFTDAVRQFSSTELAGCGLNDHPLLESLSAPSAATLDLLRDREAHATLALYGEAEDLASRRAILSDLRPALQRCFTALFETRRQVAAGSGLSNFLRTMPVGLILFDWFGTAISINDEGYRQAVVWNAAPARAHVKNARAQFSVPADLMQGLNAQKAAWIEWLRGDRDRPAEHHVVHSRSRALKAIVDIVEDPETPSPTPCFMVRFVGFHMRSGDGNASPTLHELGVFATLSPAERSVAVLVRAGLTNKEIAERLGRQVSTVKDHVTAIYAKTGISRRSQFISLLHDVPDSL